MAAEEFDLLVIGGGINGLGIAADAAARGLSTAVVERGDLAGGTTATSSRLIHGGLRYLQYGELDLVRESLRERGRLVRQRPHLVRPIRLTIPTFIGQPMPAWMVGAGLLAYDILAHDPAFARPGHVSRAALERAEPGLRSVGLTGGFVYPDAQIAYPERLCVELAQETVAAGGTVHTYTQAVRLMTDRNRVVGATVCDAGTGAEETLRARLTINAAGPWVDAVNRTLATPPPEQLGGTWGTHLILPARENGPQGPLYATARADGRPFFLLPWDGRLLVGTTDIKFTGENPDSVAVTEPEIDYLLSETNHLFPDCHYTHADIQATTVGVRPLPRSQRSAGAVTRRHFLVDHAKHGLGGLASVVGGKLTTYRSLGESVTDWALAQLGKPAVACSTAEIAAPPAGDTDIAALRLKLAQRGVDPRIAERLYGLYGPTVDDLLARIDRDPSLATPLPDGSGDLEVQVMHAVRAEFARTALDIVRRRLVRLPQTPAALAAVRRVAQERGLPLLDESHRDDR